MFSFNLPKMGSTQISTSSLKKSFSFNKVHHVKFLSYTIRFIGNLVGRALQFGEQNSTY